MDDSDDDYVEYLSSDGEVNSGVSRRTRNRDSARPSGRSGRAQASASGGGYAWEDEYHRSWDIVQEDAAGSLEGAVAGLVADQKKRRAIKDARPVRRGIIRNMVLILDLSDAMNERDLRPTRHATAIATALDFCNDFFDQNPVSRLGVIGMREGIAVPVAPLDAAPAACAAEIAALKSSEPKGNPSLQNALEAARAMLQAAPEHSSREVVVVFGALLSADPGDIHATIERLVKDRVRVRVVGLAAQVAVCKMLVEATNNGDGSGYGVALNETHFHELLMESTSPLAVPSSDDAASRSAALVRMGFPSRIAPSSIASLCACHSRPTTTGYLCPRCQSKVCALPALCPCCGLTLILSTHLARSYHHLFPLKVFKEIPGDDTEVQCLGCHHHIGGKESRYSCPLCKNLFCIDCDIFCHETLHNCPGCEAHIQPKQKPGLKVKLTMNSAQNGANSVDGVN
uniref:General transcription and DNA repair factor IIH n=1 Tax=Blastobotrys adeninivorans TaxID=409370 RepID=A0A060T899_BLAAD